MDLAEIFIEETPDSSVGQSLNDYFKKGIDVVLFSGEITQGIDKILAKNIFKECPSNKHVCLILCTPGGDADSAYLIARKFNRRYDSFNILVNGYCKSAGTLLSLGANELIVTEEAEFGPLDVQLFNPDEFLKRSSGLTITQAARWVNEQVFESFEEFFIQLRQRSGGNITTKTAGEIAGSIVSSLYDKITDKIDPVIIGEMQRAVDIAVKYGERLGVHSYLISHLAKDYPSHSFVIDFEEAKSLFPNCRLANSAECVVLDEIQRILCKEFDRDLTQIPADEGLIAIFKMKEERKDASHEKGDEESGENAEVQDEKNEC